MIGELTFDKANKNVSLFLYSIVVINEFGENGTMRRNFCQDCFVEKMEDFTGINAYNDEGSENRTLYNKSLYTQYYGFLDRFKDENNNEYIRITPRGKQLLQYIEENTDSDSYESKYYIPEEYRNQVQELLWSSILFDSHGKHNTGAQRSKTDIDPPKVFIKVLFDIEKASNEELFYILFSLNKGDHGTLSISKTYKQLLAEVLKNRTSSHIDYKDFFKTHGLKNKVNDSKVIDILSDSNFEIINKVDENGVIYNYLSPSFKRFSSQSTLLSTTSSPLQYFIYGNDAESSNKWIQENILGRYGDHRHIAKFYDTSTSTLSDILSLAKQANETENSDFYCIINAQNEDEVKSLFGQYILLTNREDDINLVNFGYSKTTSAQQNNLRFTPNFHIIASIPMSDSITTNSIFDGSFRRIRVEEENPQEHSSNNSNDKNATKDKGFNKIFYGAPGTGKSHTIDEDYIKSHKSYRITFHPDTDYASFVGCYKPSMGGTDKEQITYAFVPQVFLNAYAYAWNNRSKPVYLVIEEINRGNCAQIFGDIFQLLDRQHGDNAGFSRYTINADTDIANHIATVIGEQNTEYERELKSVYNIQDFDYSIMALPDNLYILATMNTSDQSLFPIDSAFKRRWDMEYIKVDYKDAAKFKLVIDSAHTYNWDEVLKGLNAYIKTETQSTNKLIGNRFIIAKDGTNIDLDSFRDKLLFFLFHDVFKDNDDFKATFFGEESENMFFEDLCITKDTQYIINFIENICKAKSI